MVRVAAGLSFNEDIAKERATLIGGLPEFTPNPNLDRDMYNPYAGSFSIEEILKRAEENTKLGTELIGFLNRAYNHWGDIPFDPYHPDRVPVDFSRLFAEASNFGFINAINNPAGFVPISQSIWNVLRSEDHPQFRNCFHPSIKEKIGMTVPFEDSTPSSSPPPLIPESPINAPSLQAHSSVSSSDMGELANFDMEKAWEEALANVDHSKVLKNIGIIASSPTAHARFANVQPIAYTDAGEPIFQDRFEALLFFAYHRGAEDVLGRVQKALDEANSIDASLVIEPAVQTTRVSNVSSIPTLSHSTPAPTSSGSHCHCNHGEGCTCSLHHHSHSSPQANARTLGHNRVNAHTRAARASPYDRKGKGKDAA
jgi:hypothetical protein